jgi:hypothetical protein
MGSSQPGARRANVRPPRTDFCPKCLGQVPKSTLKKHVLKCQGKQSSRQREPEAKPKVYEQQRIRYNHDPNNISTWGTGQW